MPSLRSTNRVSSVSPFTIEIKIEEQYIGNR
jgi:hypothetical protein